MPSLSFVPLSDCLFLLTICQTAIAMRGIIIETTIGSHSKILIGAESVEKKIPAPIRTTIINILMLNDA